MVDRPKVLVAVTGQRSCEALIHAGAELAKELDADLSVVHVSKRGNNFLGGSNDAEVLEYLFEISKNYDADMMLLRNDDVAGTLAAHARRIGTRVLVVGSRGKPAANPLLRQLGNALPEIEIKTIFTSEG